MVYTVLYSYLQCIVEYFKGTWSIFNFLATIWNICYELLQMMLWYKPTCHCSFIISANNASHSKWWINQICTETNSFFFLWKALTHYAVLPLILDEIQLLNWNRWTVQKLLIKLFSHVLQWFFWLEMYFNLLMVLSVKVSIPDNLVIKHQTTSSFLSPYQGCRDYQWFIHIIAMPTTTLLNNR